jgi:hypothetical protein
MYGERVLRAVVQLSPAAGPTARETSFTERSPLVFGSSAGDMSELMGQLSGDWSLDADYERVMGPMFERYDADDDVASRDGTFEFYVPVDEG